MIKKHSRIICSYEPKINSPILHSSVSIGKRLSSQNSIDSLLQWKDFDIKYAAMLSKRDSSADSFAWR